MVSLVVTVVVMVGVPNTSRNSRTIKSIAAWASVCISTVSFCSTRRCDDERKALYACADRTLNIATAMSSSVTVWPCSDFHMLIPTLLANDGRDRKHMRLRLILPTDENADALGIGQRAIGDGDLSGKCRFDAVTWVAASS